MMSHKFEVRSIVNNVIIFFPTFLARLAFPLPIGAFILARAAKNFSTGRRFFSLLATTDSGGCGSQLGKGGGDGLL